MELFDFTFGGLLEKYAAETPEQDFIVFPDRGLRFSYSTFNHRVDQIAKGLIHLGVKEGDKVGMWANNVPDWLTYLFAAAKIGAVFVTINTNYKTAELEYLMKNADIHTLCMVGRYRDSDYVRMVYDLVPELKEHGRGELKSERFPELRNVVYLGQKKFRGLYNTSELLLLGSHLSDEKLNEAKSKVNTHDVTNMQYTSGTTGFPKGVMLSHHNILNNGYATGECMEYTEKDRLLVCVPFFHCFGCVLALCAIVTHGATMVVVEDFDPLLVLASIQKEKCTAIYGVPTMFIAELNHPMFDMFDLTTLRTGIMAGAPCPIDTMKQVMNKMHCKDIIIVYGLTESSPGMTATRVHNTPEVKATTVGYEYPNVEVKVVNPETGEECLPGVVGELCCRGYNVMKGYYKNEEETRSVIDSEEWLHSGDLGIRDEDGFFKITGRIKDMIIRGGENIYPREIENYLYGMEQIEAVEVAGIPSPKYGEQVGVFIKVKRGYKLGEDEITEFCRGRISRFKIPRYVFFVDSFPMTASGKIQKYKLKELGVKLLEKQGVTIT